MEIRWQTAGMPRGEMYAIIGGINARILKTHSGSFLLHTSGAWKSDNPVFRGLNTDFSSLEAAKVAAYYLRYRMYRYLCDEVGVMPAPMPPLPDEKWAGRGLLDLAKQARRRCIMMQEWQQDDPLNEVSIAAIRREWHERMAALLEWRAGRAVNREHDERIIGVGSDGLPNYSGGGGPVSLDHIPF